MKKILILVGIVLVGLLIISAWLLFGSATSFTGKSAYVFIRNGQSAEAQVKAQFDTGNIIKFPWLFNLAASQTGIWEKLKPGRFEIKKDETILDMARMFRNNAQSPVKLVITKLRTKENLARLISKNFDIDSAAVMQSLTNNDSLKQFAADTNTVMSLLIPDTYQLKWNLSLNDIMNRLKTESDKYWQQNNRIEKAKQHGLTPLQAYTIASIVEEETNKESDKGKIASVYINRLDKGMPLAADPTIKYALRDFSLKRILFGHLSVASSYNTYRNKGLPPGPICTPSKNTLDAVLDAPKTDYLFFVATSDFSGYSHFSSTFAEHDRYARDYQKALNDMGSKKNTAGEKN